MAKRNQNLSILTTAVVVAIFVSCGTGKGDSSGTDDGTDDSASGTKTVASTGNGTSTESSTATATEASVTNPKCSAAAADAAIATYQDFVALLNNLVADVGELDTACIVAALPRPLRVNATSSELSIQPASGPDNPRLFVVAGSPSEPLIIGFGVSGKAASLVEFSVLQAGNKSVKGEILLPLKDQIDVSAPFVRASSKVTDGTTCKGCHGVESAAPASFGEEARLSPALRPMPHFDVSLLDLEALKVKACETASNDRCRVLQSLFGGAAPERYDFPESMGTLW